MRSLFFDELAAKELNEIRNYFDEHLEASAFSDLYWLVIPEKMLTEFQKENLLTQEAYKVAVELEEKSFKIELLVRAANIENIGTAHANNEQLLFISSWAEEMVRKLDLVTCY